VAAQAGVTLDVSDKPPLAPGVALPAEERVWDQGHPWAQGLQARWAMDKAALSAASGAAAVCPLDPGWAERRADPASGHSLQQ
jgi:hypothetical protein